MELLPEFTYGCTLLYLGYYPSVQSIYSRRCEISLSTKVILIYAGVSKRLIFHTMHTFRGSIFIFELIIEFTFGTFLVTYLSTLRCLSVLSTIVQKGGDCWCKFLAPCVLEIVDRNRHGLICLLVHTERNSPCKYRRLCCLRCTVRRTSPKIIYVEEDD